MAKATALEGMVLWAIALTHTARANQEQLRKQMLTPESWGSSQRITSCSIAHGYIPSRARVVWNSSAQVSTSVLMYLEKW